MRSQTSLQWSSSESSNMWKMPFSNQGSFLWPWNLASSWFCCMLVCVYICACMHALSVISVVGEGGELLSGEQTFFWSVEFWWNRAVFVFDAEQHFLSTASLLLSDFMQYQCHFRHSDSLGYYQIYRLWKRIHHNVGLTYQKQSTYSNLLRAETVIGYPIFTDFQSRSWVLHQSKDLWLALSPKKEALGSETGELRFGWACEWWRASCCTGEKLWSSLLPSFPLSPSVVWHSHPNEGLC